MGGQALAQQGNHAGHSEVAAEANSASIAADGASASDLHQAEMGQAHGPAGVEGDVVQAETRPTSVPAVGQRSHALWRPVVQGIPLAGASLPRPRQDNFLHGVGGQISPAAVAYVAPAEEIVVMNYRAAIMCFSMLDIVTTSFHVMHELLTVHDPNAERMIAFASIILLVGPMCGYIGAKTLNRTLVGVYFFFCILELVRTVYVLAVFPFLVWLVFGLLFQVWITKIVGTFYTSLGSLSATRRSEMLTEKNVEGQIVYW